MSVHYNDLETKLLTHVYAFQQTINMGGTDADIERASSQLTEWIDNNFGEDQRRIAWSKAMKSHLRPGSLVTFV